MSHLLNMPHEKEVQSVIYQCFAWQCLSCYRHSQYRLTVSDLWEHYENRAKVMKCQPLLCLKIKSKIVRTDCKVKGSPWTTRLKNKYKYHHWNSWRRVTCLDRITLTQRLNQNSTLRFLQVQMGVFQDLTCTAIYYINYGM